MEKELKNLIKQLRRQATLAYKKVGHDASHYEGVCKGMYLGYEEAASRLERILKDNEKKNKEQADDPNT